MTDLQMHWNTLKTHYVIGIVLPSPPRVLPVVPFPSLLAPVLYIASQTRCEYFENSSLELDSQKITVAIDNQKSGDSTFLSILFC